MNKYIVGFAVVSAVILGAVATPLVAHAMTPTLSLSATGSGDNVQVTVQGDASSSVLLYYQSSGYQYQTQSIGTTNMSGSYSYTISTATYGIIGGSLVHVIVNNQQSLDVAWPYGSGSNTLSLSQTSLSMSTGQTATVTAYNTGYSLYISNNTNSSVASATISGNQITITANNYGSTTMTICAQSNTCATIMVNVQYRYNNNYGSGTVSVSQSSVTLAVGQSADITVSGGTMPYTMFSGSTNIFQSAIGGNTLTLTGLANGSGTLSVCSSAGNGSGCASIYVTISGSGYNYNNIYNNTQISLSQSSISVNSGSSTTVTITGNGGYYISNNTNPNIASAYISGNSVSVSGLAYGSDTISICQSGGQCATLYVSVGYNNNNNYYGTVTPITFSQPSPSLNVGQSTTVTIYGALNYIQCYGCGGGANYYVAYNSNTSAVTTSISGSTLTLTGVSNTAAGIVVCSSTNTCGALTVTVGGTNQSGWTHCANEGQWCSFSGTRQIRYGANNSYYYRSFTGGVSCSNATFGDPAYDVVKQCSYAN
ncbi:MAG: hypothetical protein A3A33_02395 [Candidatus Yanofskybacteria bacterium RIFCSPLOWO2_01_FULL_49_25]|uniref:Uncharacterized protein n=1 Tax=Candidatus Yanofskybacteria bacterium RIFCSPLOWO2_01_FULL_49_25 TaxID=1802701 RepID=A0A1F8GRX9_9BACT|nr:MAG: hypothetical protein A3A33_02395 [Candidatus Yanofskybacteria bacterium RIFCSPLOWO2_01_FULL_49_25]